MTEQRKITEKEEKNQEYTESYIQIIMYLEKHQDVGLAFGALRMKSVRKDPHPDADANCATFSSIDGLIAAERDGQPTFSNQPAILEGKLINQEKLLRTAINESLKEGEVHRVARLIEFNGYTYHPLSEIDKNLGRIVVYGSQSLARMERGEGWSYVLRSPTVAIVVDISKPEKIKEPKNYEFTQLTHCLAKEGVVEPYNEYCCNAPPGRVPIRLMVAQCETSRVYYLNHHPMYWQTLNSADLDNLMQKAGEVAAFLERKKI